MSNRTLRLIPMIFSLAFSLLIWSSSTFAAVDDTVVIIIDMQEAFMKRASQAQRHALESEQLKLLEWARRTGKPVMAIEYRGFGPTVDPIRNYLETFPAGQVVRILKDRMDAFTASNVRTEIVNRLEKWHAKKLVVCGIYSSECVRATVYSAAKRQYQVFLAGNTLGDLYLKPASHDDFDERVHFFDDLQGLRRCMDILEN